MTTVCPNVLGRHLYRIRPNYHTYPYKRTVKHKRTVKQFHSLQITASVIFVYFFTKAYVVGTHLNCIDLSMQFKWVPITHAFIKKIRKRKHKNITCQPRWLSWMRRLTVDHEVVGSTPTEVGNILSWRLIVKYFLWSFSSFRWFKKGSCQFLAKECAQYWLTA